MRKPSAVIFDLDDTLISTAEIGDLRQAKKWRECVGRLNLTSIYDGISELLVELARVDVPFAVVTSSVSFYAAAALKHHRIGSPPLVAYHDTDKHKPHPEPIIRALRLIKVTPNVSVVGIGDSRIDAEAYVSSGISAVGASWSAAFHSDAPWGRVIAHPLDLLK